MSLNTAQHVVEERNPWPGDGPTGETVLSERKTTRVAAFSILAPMWEFNTDGLTLKCDKPVPVKFEYSETGVVAECERLHVFARGRSHSDCVHDLEQQVGHFYRLYTSCGDDDVAGLAAQIRQLYQEHFSVV